MKVPLGHSKLFIFIFVILKKGKKKKIKGFSQRILQDFMKKKYLEHQMLGRRVIFPIGPANQIVTVDCRI